MRYFYEILSNPIVVKNDNFIGVNEQGHLLPFFGSDTAITELQNDVLQVPGYRLCISGALFILM
jgi:hypothetical protein